MKTSFGKQVKMKYCEIFLFLQLIIMDVSTNAQEVTCEGEQLINVDILIGHPGIVSPYKPGHVLVFRCTDANLTMNGQRAIECLSNGKWDHPYPKCEVTCELKSTIFGEKKINPEGKTIFRAGESVEITCSEKYWIFSTRETSKSFTCQDNGQWDHEPVCAGAMKCGKPPHVSDADTRETTKNEYNTGERVEYICFNKYTMDLSPPFSTYLTCQQGEWRGTIKCLKPCTVTKKKMDERGIMWAYGNEEKIFAQHNEHITFVCQRGKVSKGIFFRQKCNDGEMTLPECV